jgi:putative addiction module component (TIGR02574 family)
MTQDLEAILHTALSLPPEKRAALAEKLLDSLDENRAEIEAAWADEAESRIRAFEQGALKAIPGDEVLGTVQPGKKP